MSADTTAELRTTTKAIVSVANVTDDLTLRDCVRNAAVNVLTTLTSAPGPNWISDISFTSIAIADEFERQLDHGTD